MPSTQVVPPETAGGVDILNPPASLTELLSHPSPAPRHWADPCTHHECTLHQLSPYIGKLKSGIARDLILRYSAPGHLVVDMFCGSGTVPLEAALLGRQVFASDVSTYAVTLTRGKLAAPNDPRLALAALDSALASAESLTLPTIEAIPDWVQSFFHPRTLQESLRLTRLLKRTRADFLLSAMLGILHHQRPGFLSHPSSHLVPYLRSNKFPRSEYPELYQYRAIRPRLRAKVQRSLRRISPVPINDNVLGVCQDSVNAIDLPENIDCVITSPPYMNALDYYRDNRLRSWFLEDNAGLPENRDCKTASGFQVLMRMLFDQLRHKIRRGGHCIFVIGDRTARGFAGFPSRILLDEFVTGTSPFHVQAIIKDQIPDVRRSRRNRRGVRAEHIIVLQRV